MFGVIQFIRSLLLVAIMMGAAGTLVPSNPVYKADSSNYGTHGVSCANKSKDWG